MQKERPLSPHISVYNMFQLTSFLSIVHRATGVFLSLAVPVLVLWLWSVSEGEMAFNAIKACFSEPIAQLLLLAWVFSLYYHLCNGIRHLFWDIGRGFELSILYKTGALVVISALFLTAITVYFALKGGLA